MNILASNVEERTCCEAYEYEPNTVANPLSVGGVRFDVADAICDLPDTRNDYSRTYKKSCRNMPNVLFQLG
jgi:hypothetical protein